MKALVTGATGFVGGLLAEHLVECGHAVTALIRDPARARDLAERGVRIVHGDLAAEAALGEAASSQDVVFHVAGIVRARRRSEFTHTNVDGTRRLVRGAERTGAARFVHVSSMAAVGPVERGRWLTGEEPERPTTAYGRSKLAAERVVRESGLAWTIVRPPMVYGPRDRELLLVFRACRFGIVPVFGDGKQELCAVYGPDLAEALAAVARTDRTIGHTYYACHAERFTSTTLGRAIGRVVGRDVRVLRIPHFAVRPLLAVTGLAARLLGRATILDTDKTDEFLAPAWTADPSPIARDAGWSARHDLPSGLRATADWYRERGWLAGVRRP